MKKLSMVGGVVVGGVAVAAMCWPREAREVEPVPAARAGVAPQAVTAGATRHGCLFAPKGRHAWALETTTRATVAPASLGVAGAGEVTTRNEGTQRARLEVEGLSALDDGTVVLGRLVDVDQPTLQQVPGLSQTPFLFKVSSRCEVTGFARHRAATLLSARTQQATLAQLWFRVPRSAEAEPAMAENGLGPYRAMVASAGGVAQRRVMAYERAWAGAEVPSVKDSFLSVTLGDGVWFESMRGEEKVSSGVFVDASASFEARRTKVNPSSLADAPREPDTYVWENLLPRVVKPASGPAELTTSERARRAALVDQPLTEAVREFAAAVVAEPNLDLQWRGLARYLEVHPEAIADFVGAMRQPDFPKALKAAGFVAVGHAAPSQAREALMGVRNDASADPYDRIRASLALVGRADVGVELAARLRRDSAAMVTAPTSAEGFYGRNALLALGMFSGLRQNEDAEVKAEARAAITQALEASALQAEGAPAVSFPAAMGAMGNLGDPDDLPAIIELSKHANPDVRRLVPQAMRRLPQAHVAAFTLEWLARETSPDVKQELYGVIHHQLLDEQQVATEALARQAVKDLQAQPLLLTRQPLVRLLGPVASRYDFVREALVAQAVREVGTRSGLYTVIAQYVPGGQVSAALARHPAFAQEGSLGPTGAGPQRASGVEVAP